MDLFSRSSDSFGGSFAADSAKLVFPGMGGEFGMLVQQMQAQYSQQLSKIYEVGSNKFYYVAGRTTGGLNINRIDGPVKLGRTFLEKFGNVCNAGSNNMSFQLTSGCGAGGGSNTTYTAKFVVVQAVTIAVASQDMMINNGIQAMFGSFSYE